MVESAAKTSSKMRRVSATFPLFNKTVTGLRASTTAEASPAPAPATRRTARYKTSTVSVPSIT